MPTYEYKCIDCDHRFEEFQSISSEPITICPECGGKTERIISGGAGFIFEGSGFYITENRKSDYKSAAEKDKPSKAVTETSSTKKDKKTETKPTKKESK